MSREEPTYYFCFNCGFYHFSESNCMLTKKEADKIREKLDKKMDKKKKPREYCIVCENKIFRSTNPQSSKPRRSIFAVTCSGKCSKIYLREINNKHIKCSRIHFKRLRDANRSSVSKK